MHVLNQAQAVGIEVVPSTTPTRPVLQVTKRLIPPPAAVVPVALEVVAAGDAQEAWVQVLNGFHEILAHAVRPVIVGRREEADEVKVQYLFRALRLKGQGELVLVTPRLLRHNLKLVLRPLALLAPALDLHARPLGAPGSVAEGGCEVAAVVAPDVERTLVRLRQDVDAPVPGVGEAYLDVLLHDRGAHGDGRG